MYANPPREHQCRKSGSLGQVAPACCHHRISPGITLRASGIRPLAVRGPYPTRRSPVAVVMVFAPVHDETSITLDTGHRKTGTMTHWTLNRGRDPCSVTHPITSATPAQAPSHHQEVVDHECNVRTGQPARPSDPKAAGTTPTRSHPNSGSGMGERIGVEVDRARGQLPVTDGTSWLSLTPVG